MADDFATLRLAQQLADMERRLRALERGSQLGRSSIEAGALTVNDETGAPVLLMGLQDDGTYAVTGANGGQVVATTIPQEVIDEITAELELADGAVTEAKLAAGAVTETKIADDAVSSPKIIAGAIQALHIAADAVAAGKIAANAVTAREIAALAVTAAKIAAGSITADRLGIGVLGGELVPDGSFESADMRAKRSGGSWYFDTASAAPRFHGDAFARVDGSAAQFKPLVLTDEFPVKAGEKYTGTFAYRGTTGTDGFVQLQMEVTLQDGSKAFPQVGGQGNTADETWRTLTNTVTMPANAKSAHVYLQTQNQTTGGWAADAVSVRRVVPGVEIADGAITTPKLAAGSITADKLDANAITGKTITGGNFFTSAAAPRLEMGEGIVEDGDKPSVRWNLLGDEWDEPTIQAYLLDAANRRFQIRGPARGSGAKGVTLSCSEPDYAWEMLCWTDAIAKIVKYRFTPDGFTINDVDQGRGLVGGVRSYAPTSIPFGTDETVVAITSPMVWRAGRAYRVWAQGRGFVNATGQGADTVHRVRKTSVSGPLLATFWCPHRGVSGNYSVDNAAIVVNSSAANVTAAIVLTGSNSAGASVATLDAGATFPIVLEVYDVGSAAKYAGAPNIAA